MTNDTPLYEYSFNTARENDEVALWRDSLKANIACKEAIDRVIRENFDGMHLNGECVKGVIEEFGFKRTRYVLVNTMQEKDYDGRFSQANRNWAAETYVLPDKEHNYLFCCNAHPAVLDGFIQNFRQELQSFDLIGRDDLPGWAAEKLEALRSPKQEQTGMTMSGLSVST